jgi:hypothetical protein
MAVEVAGGEAREVEAREVILLLWLKTGDGQLWRCSLASNPIGVEQEGEATEVGVEEGAVVGTKIKDTGTSVDRIYRHFDIEGRRYRPGLHRREASRAPAGRLSIGRRRWFRFGLVYRVVVQLRGRGAACSHPSSCSRGNQADRPGLPYLRKDRSMQVWPKVQVLPHCKLVRQLRPDGS